MTYPLTIWAQQYPEAAAALAALSLPPPPVTGITGSEALVQSQVRLEAPRHGMKLQRNNVGAMQDESGRVVRFGLANDTAALNKVLKSSDLIGWKSEVITPDMVGQRNARFVSIECKHSSWKYTGTGREVAQLNWLNLVNAAGGIGFFSTGQVSR